MINVVLKEGSPRTSYTIDFIFKHILNVPCTIYERNVFEIKAAIGELHCHVNFTNDIDFEGVSVFNSAFLLQNDIKKFEPEIKPEKIPQLFPNPGADKFDINFDLFAASFYLLTEYDKYMIDQRDSHGRIPDNLTFVFRNELYKQPLINIYAEQLREKICEKFPDLTEELNDKNPNKRKFTYELSFDIDFPWAYKHKGIVTYLGIARDILKRDFTGLKLRLQTISGKKDPYDVFDKLFELCPVEHTRFFFLINGLSKFDSRFTERNLAYRQLISKIFEKGYACGIHPSYLSSRSKTIMKDEVRALEKILKAKVISSRQHFLKYALPETYHLLQLLGIKKDYTGTFANVPGFKYSIAQPFPWFDLINNMQTPLWIHPTMVMDATLAKYQKLNTANALSMIKKYIDITKKYNGKFVLLWHNSSMSKLDGYAGWDNLLFEAIEYLKHQSDNK